MMDINNLLETTMGNYTNCTSVSILTTDEINMIKSQWGQSMGVKKKDDPLKNDPLRELKMKVASAMPDVNSGLTSASICKAREGSGYSDEERIIHWVNPADGSVWVDGDGAGIIQTKAEFLSNFEVLDKWRVGLRFYEYDASLLLITHRLELDDPFYSVWERIVNSYLNGGKIIDGDIPG